MGNNATGFRSVRAGLGASQRLDHNQRYVYTQFRESMQIGDGLGGAVGKSDTNVNHLVVGQYAFNYRLEQDLAGANPVNSNDGLLFVLDAADNQGFELNLGRTLVGQDTVEATKSLGAFTIGTDADFFLRVKLDIATVANSDEVAVGFSTGSYPASGTINIMPDFAALVMSDGDIFNESRINAGSDVSTDSTQNWTDADQITFEVQVSAGGVVALFIDGAVPTTQMATFTFDNADVVHAFLSVMTEDGNTADPVVSVMEWESGFLSTRGIEFGVAPNLSNEPAQSYVGV